MAATLQVTSGIGALQLSVTGLDSGYSQQRWFVWQAKIGSTLVVDEMTLAPAYASSASFYMDGLQPGVTYSIQVGIYSPNWELFTILYGSGTPYAPSPTWSLSTASYGQITQKTSVSYSLGSYTLKRVAVSFKYAGRAYFYSTGSYDTFGFLSTRTEWDSGGGAPLYYIKSNDDDDTGKTTGYNFGFYYDVQANTTYYVWVRALNENQSIYCGIVVEPPAPPPPPTGSISGNAISASSYSVTASNLRTYPDEYYAMFVADLNTDGTISGYHCRYCGKPTATSVSYTGSTSATYSKYVRPVYLVYSSTYFSVGTKYQLSAFSADILASGYVPSILGTTAYIYATKNGVSGWYPAIVHIWNNGNWTLATPNIYDGGWN